MISDEEIIRIAREAGIEAGSDTLCSYPDHIEPLKAFAARVVANIDPSKFMSYQEGFEVGKSAAQKELREMQDRIETLYEMYQQACQQRDMLMDQQRAQIAAMRGQLQ